MNRESIAKQLQIEQGLLESIVSSLRSVLNWKTDHASASRKLSTLRHMTDLFHRHLERLTGIHEYDGYMSHVVISSPQFASAIDVLKHDHGVLRTELNRVIAQLERLTLDDPAALENACRSVRKILVTYDEHNRREVELLQGSLLREVGGRG